MRSFFETEQILRTKLLETQPNNRGEWQAQKVTDPIRHTHEILHTQLKIDVEHHQANWAKAIEPNLSWAEDHFRERVSGEPLNPPPSNEWWPYAQAGNAQFKADEKFSHTYPERFWPIFANVGGTTDEGRQIMVPHVGIRYKYGDLSDLVTLLVNNPLTRQAYLPVWFPEDLHAAGSGERVPCTLGYHFIMNTKGELDITYHIRSCDFVRHFRDDVYMAGRLLQWVVAQINQHVELEDDPWQVGQLVMNIGSLHCFVGDVPGLKYDQREYQKLQNERLMNSL